MQPRKDSDTERRFAELAGIYKLRALLSAAGVLNKEIAIATGVHISDVTRWFACERNVGGAAEYVARRLGVSIEEVEALRKDQPPTPAGAAS